MPSEMEPAAILTRFPGPVRFTPSPRKWLLVLAGCAAFVAIGISLLKEDSVIAWLCIGFFGLGVLVAAAMLVPGAGALVLDEDGFDYASLFRHHRARWADSSGFAVARIPPAGQKLVVYDNASIKGRLAEFNVKLTGRNSALPDSYRLTPEDLAQVMVAWRERAVATR